MTKGIDHLVLCVRNLDAARTRYQEMGFTLTPKAVHPFGTANSLVQFADNSFLEPLAIADRDLIVPPDPGFFSFAEYNRQFIEEGPGEGFSMLVMDSSDSEVDHADYTGAGLAPYEHFGFRRQATLPSGEQVEVRFSMAFVTDPNMPQTAYFCCQQHHAPELFWKREYQSHANSALGMAEVVLLADEPKAHTQFFTALSASSDVSESDEKVTITTARGVITLLNMAEWSKHYPANYAPDTPRGPRLAAYRLNVADLGAVTDCLRTANIHKIRAGDDIVVAPDEAFGVMIGFSES